MSKIAHRIYIFSLALMVLIVLIFLVYRGSSYYRTSLEERFYHADHAAFKPSGIWGHGLGIIGSLFLIIGVSTYMIRKRWRRISRLGILKHWLEFHIFLCTLGPVMVLFHTSFKFGGLVAISFWSMVAVFLSGIIGRFIYIQIPRTIEGRELSLNEILGIKGDLGALLKVTYDLDEESHRIILESAGREPDPQKKKDFAGFFTKYFEDSRKLKKIRSVLKKNVSSREERRRLIELVKHEISLNRKIDRLVTMKNLFRYWHVVHLPFALIMLVIMIIHVAVTIAFGYQWIF